VFKGLIQISVLPFTVILYLYIKTALSLLTSQN